MKKYIVKYAYNHGQLESTMTVEAESPEAAEEKAREYCIDRVISVKEDSPKQFIVMPFGGRWTETEGTSAEAVYSSICCWYGAETQVAIMDKETGKTEIFTRLLDKAGNLIKIIRR